MLRDLFDSLVRLIFGHNTVDNAKDWHEAHQKANESRAEVDQIIAEANKEKKG